MDSDKMFKSFIRLYSSIPKKIIEYNNQSSKLIITKPENIKKEDVMKEMLKVYEKDGKRVVFIGKEYKLIYDPIVGFQWL
ncbi:Hypothetical protein ORPV_411 [Orpheovirus IHUMI-LCC2]|uniref:Uncharacterized protein n=1 Tax=Orpheovirus IHUMI-LCC2 TaxID=2023057 RepID=A0A2I2L435_9VIRU|nr:Hypothetical protein ORPV_411 [Orpheovirus IHUMI-LCC2]SNW62315.1 Hypothetical protein ORPV_411 [Orpheovirus IHUMI-LCC2]